MTRTYPDPWRPRGILLDMDGVLFHGESALPGATDFMAAVSSIPHVFITNNPIRTPVQVAERLERLGFTRPDPGFIVTSAQATARWLNREKPGFHYFAVGADGLRTVLDRVGTEDPENADFVVVGEGPGLDYASLTTGINLILRRGARLVATNPDTSVDDTRDGRHRVLPGGGALVAPFTVATGREPVVIGKPNPLLFRMGLETLGLAAPDTLMVGDRPDTDIAGAAGIGIRTALVRTGRFGPRESWPAERSPPDWDLPNLDALRRSLGL